jgi:hypothetical protein
VEKHVGAPKVVDGRLWGAAVVGSLRPEPLPPDTEARVGDFADIVATAIANAQARAELTASRRGLSRPPIVPGADSNATCMTVLSSGSSRWGCSYAWPRFRFPPN